MVARPDLDDLLFKAADKLRGNMDAAAYKHVLVGLLFLRGLHSRLGAGLPPEARWEALRPGRIASALHSIERAHPDLRGVLPRGLDSVPRLDELLDLVGELDAAGPAELGRVTGALLARFARAEGRRGGQFFTPPSVVRLLVGITGPVEGRVYDPCCGAGGMFVQAGLQGRPVELFGQESNPDTWRLAHMNCWLHDLRADLGAGPADTLRDDRHAGREADVVLANPPFNQADWRGEADGADDPRWRFGVPPRSNGNFAWVQHVLAHLAPGGRAAIVLANCALSARRAGEGAIRRALIEAGHVSAVYALPARLFPTTPIPVCVLVLTREPADTTLLVDARGLGTPLDRARAELAPATITRLVGLHRAAAGGRRVHEPGLATVVDRAALLDADGVLTPARSLGPVRLSADSPDDDELEELWRAWDRAARRSERWARAIERMRDGVD